MNKPPKWDTILEGALQLQKTVLPLLIKECQAGRRAKRANNRKKVAHHSDRIVNIVSNLDTYYFSPMQEWWKEEHFRRLLKSGYCFTCQGDGKVMESSGDPKHPLHAITCPDCKGKGKGLKRAK